MKFIDTAKFKLIAGNGGNGAIAFRREKFVPHGGPNGGNGGNGASIYFLGDKSRHTLLDFRYKREYKGKNGANGGGTDKYGAAGEDLILPVPLGTVIFNTDTGELLADITEDQKMFLIAKGGDGGRGNMHFATPTQRAPRHAEDGWPGEEIEITLELKLIADIAIVGLPNAGKSTFIARVSAAKPKIADYPFTTLTPNLGVVKTPYGDSYVIADMPGLIENAHKGAGLGLEFLRHIERTVLLLHFVDASAEESMVDSYKLIRNELTKHKNNLSEKKEVIALTKIEAANEENVKEFLDFIAKENNTECYSISSVTGENIDNITTRLYELVLEKRKENKK